MTKHKLLALGAILLMVPLIGASCGRKAAENTAEKAIERASNGNVDVDINKNSVAVNINGTTVGAFGENVSLPDGFPSDVYVIDGSIKTAIKNTENYGYSVSIQTSKTIAEAKSLYSDKLKAQGWNETLNMDASGSSTISAEKDSRSTIVMISASEGATLVLITVTQNQT